MAAEDNTTVGESDPESQRRLKPLSARDAQTALLQQLMGDVDQLVTRVEQASSALDAASTRLERATQAAQANFATSAEAAKSSVGEWITRTTNDVTARALDEHRQAIDQAVSAALGRAVLAAQEQASRAAPVASRGTASESRLWLGVALGAVGAAAVGITLWWLVGGP